jgi:hypothetical protein
MRKGIAFTPEQISFLQLFAPAMTPKEVSHLFNRRFACEVKPNVIRNACKYRGISIKSDGDGRFKKGITVWNKGKKGQRYSKQTEFKPGSLPSCTLEIGTIKTSSQGYLYKKIDSVAKGKKTTNWKLVHHLVWMEFHGDIPAGHIIVFKDGDKTNCSISNLDCISRAKHAMYNRFLKEIRAFECYESKSLLADLMLANGQAAKRRRD